MLGVVEDDGAGATSKGFKSEGAVERDGACIVLIRGKFDLF